ncbi:10987_t:CDS:2, partial [Gigaspora margarita]
YSEYGNVCVLTESTKKFDNYTLFTTYQINFLSSGSVIKFTTLNISTINNTIKTDLQFKIQPSFYGGTIITSWASLPSNSSTNGDYYEYVIRDNNYTNMTGSIFGATFNLMKNNTYILYINYSFNEWDIFSINLPPTRNDSGYKNPNIISTYPARNDNIPISELNINITFSSEISISSNNLTIYYLDTSTNTLNFRKFYSKNSECHILFNNTLSCNVTSSIFNQWNATYIIVMDNNLVKFSSTNEPMYGIEEYIWKFTTVPCPQHSYGIHSDTAIGTLQLTLSDYIKEDSISNFLIKGLAENIPINPERLKFTDRLQSNSSTSPLQYVIQLKILSTTNSCQASVSQTINYLNELINDKNTIIYKNNYTKYLDSSYGFRVNLNLWDDIKFKLLGVLIGIIILSLIVLWARYKYLEGQNFMIFSAVIILFDLVMDILFIAENGKDVSQPDLYIIRSECSFTGILTSNFAGFATFNAPFSKSVKCWIYWMTIINTFIKSIPQLIIQVLYFRYTVEYKAIPFLTLLVSAISLLNDIILKLFKFFGNQNVSGNEDKHLYENYNNDKIQLENGENDNEENNNGENSTFIHNEDQIN